MGYFSLTITIVTLLDYNDLTGDSNVVACHCKFCGMDNSSVDGICGNGYHICDGVEEATDLGLTYSQCSSIIQDGEYTDLDFFLFLFWFFFCE